MVLHPFANSGGSATMSEPKNTDPKRPYSSELVDGPTKAPGRSMLRAVGFSDEDFKKPQIGIASTWATVTPCNMHIDKLAEAARLAADEAGGKALIFNTITISDGIANGYEGMKYSLVSREVIADSIETVAGCEAFDGLVAIGGCDKNMPGCMIALARLNRPSVFVYGGTIRPGKTTPILFLYLRRWVSTLKAILNWWTCRKLSAPPFPAPVPAAACTPPTPWHPLLKPWV